MALSISRCLYKQIAIRGYITAEVRNCVYNAARLCSSTSGRGTESADPYKSAEIIDIEQLFISDKVQNLLKSVTGFDMQKVFAPAKTELNAPRYEFMTDEQLQKAMEKARTRAQQKLQMPPVLRERKPCEKVLAKDPGVQGFDTSTYIFTDISYGYPERERIIVVREPNGLLRTANWQEREQMLHTYFTRKGREFYMPKMFEPHHLQAVLEKQWYRLVLDRACIQFEPDSPDYIRVTHATYDHIDANRKFGDLRSTRHFGPLVFYLAIRKNVDNLIVDMLLKEMIEEASNVLQLYYHIHQKSGADSHLTDVEHRKDGLDLIKLYIEKDAKKRSHLELALQTYKETQSSRQEVEEGLSVARGLQ